MQDVVDLKFPTDADGFIVFKPPPEPVWTFYICRRSGFSIACYKAPNRFWRLMQRLAFGFVWERIE